jgi:2,4-dienoyl-CoA reductase-like NADH-dependent reductase (Old Yellow Enzyme family)
VELTARRRTPILAGTFDSRSAAGRSRGTFELDPSAPLFEPFRTKSLSLPNRIVMAPMGRAHAPGGILHPDYPEYYRRRVEGGVGLILTEATAIPHPAAAFADNGPHLFGERALAEWAKAVAEVHRAGGKIVSQLWHAGMERIPGTAPADVAPIGPSGVWLPFPAAKDMPAVGKIVGAPMTEAEIGQAVEAFADGVATARDLGFDGAEIHGGHGFLIDQFLWDTTNLRTDGYGGSAAGRVRFAVEIVAASRRRVGPDFPLLFRLSQFKTTDYTARLAESPAELEQIVTSLAAAGVDIFDCSQRRFWKAEFPGSDLNLAGWTKLLTGKPTIGGGSVGVDTELWEGGLDIAAWEGARPSVAHLHRLYAMVARGDFDLVAVGRAILADPAWPIKLRKGRYETFVPFTPEALAHLI